MAFDRLQRYLREHVSLALSARICGGLLDNRIQMFADNGTGAPAGWNWLLSL